ncbi:MAG: 50S ribosomal protein L10 [Patescibacteria group bacterium]
MSKSRERKATEKDRLVEEFKNAKSAAFADYQGLTVAQATELRRKTREVNVDYIVAKKTLLSLAAKEAGYELDAKKFPGMLGVAFGHEDEIAPAKVLGDASGITALKLVGGIFEGAVIPLEKVVALSKLPSKKELLGKVVGTIYAPVSAFVRALNAIRESLEAGKPAVAEKPQVETASVTASETPTQTAVKAEPAPVVEAPVESPAAQAPAAVN